MVTLVEAEDTVTEDIEVDTTMVDTEAVLVEEDTEAVLDDVDMVDKDTDERITKRRRRN